MSRDIQLKERWENRVQILSNQFSQGEDLDLDAIIYLIGLQELGKVHNQFKKDEQLDLMHIAICKVLSLAGYYELEGLDKDGGLWYEFDPHTNEMIAEKHWWPQAELLIGFVNAWQITGDETYLDTAIQNWEFTKKFLIDHENGEWFWGVNADYSKIEKDFAGFWKCPYHNGRACMEVMKRIAD